MRVWRALGLWVAALAVAALLAAWLVPPRLDWGRFRGSVEAVASRTVGRPVQIGGDISLHLLPQPTLVAGDLRIGGGADGVALRVRELRLQVGLFALLGGRLQVGEVVLRGGVLRLPWPLPPGAFGRRPAWLRGAQARVEDSTVEVGGIAVTGIAAQFGTDRDTGTLSAGGVGTLGGHAWRFTARLAQPGGDGSAGLDASLDGEGALQDTGGSFSGVLAASGELAGRVAGRGRNLGALLPAPPVAWTAEGRLSASGGLLVADELALELAGSPARGVVALRVGVDARLDLAVAASRLDLDAWLPVLVRAPATPLPTGLDLSAEAATLAGGTLRRLRAGFDLAGGVATLRDASVVLPGDAALTLTGRVERGAEGGPGFAGTAALNAADMPATLAWLDRVAPGLGSVVPVGAMRVASVKAEVAAHAGQVSAVKIEGQVDGGAVTGGMGVRMGQRLSVTADLRVDGLRLDPWLPSPRALLAGYPWPGIAGAGLRVDTDVTLRAERVKWAGMMLSRVELAAHWGAGLFEVRRLQAAGDGWSASAAGSLAGGRLAGGRLEAEAGDGSMLRGVLPGWWGEMALLGGPVKLVVGAAGPPAALALQIVADVGDLHGEAQPVVNLPSGGWAGPVSVRHPGASRLIESMGGGETAGWLGDGSFSAVAQVAATPDGIDVPDWTVTAGSLRAKGALRFGGGGVTGTVAADSLPLPWPGRAWQRLLPFRALRGWDAAVVVTAKDLRVGAVPVLEGGSASVTVKGGVGRVDALRGRVAGGELVGTVVADGAREPPRVEVSGSVIGAVLGHAVFGTPFDVSGGRVDLQLNLAASGYSPAVLLSTLAGKASAVVREGTLQGVDLAAGAGSRSGATPFRALDLVAEVRAGLALLNTARLEGSAGVVTGTGSVDLAEGSMDVQLMLRPAQGTPVGMRVTGPLAAPRRVTDMAAVVQ